MKFKVNARYVLLVLSAASLIACSGDGQTQSVQMVPEAATEVPTVVALDPTEAPTVVALDEPLVAEVVSAETAQPTATPMPEPTTTAIPATATAEPTAAPPTLALPTATMPPPTAAPIVPVGLESLDGFLWENRLIVVFADSAELPTIEAQFWTENLAVIDRHILWFVVTENNAVSTNYDGGVSSALGENLRARYSRLGMSLETVLIGKDGGVKDRQPFLDSGSIYWQIDQMPMRRAEMEAQN